MHALLCRSIDQHITEKQCPIHIAQAKWNSFATKALGKKKSIFASPDDPYGKVGVGTCNIGGKGMTDFQQRGKWEYENKGTEGEEQ